MKSGLRDRNNVAVDLDAYDLAIVSMKSGLRDRNNGFIGTNTQHAVIHVSMKSGLRDRNNDSWGFYVPCDYSSQ